MEPTATLFTVLGSVLLLGMAIFKFVTDKKKVKHDELEAIDNHRQETSDPGLGSMRRYMWWLRNRRS